MRTDADFLLHESAIGQHRWAITEGYLAADDEILDDEELDTHTSQHETLFLLNAGEEPAHVDITLFFADRGPLGPYRYTVGPRRTVQVALSELDAPAVPRGKDFASLIQSDRAIVVLATRRRTRRDQPPLTRIAFSN
jgi:hypothetical protein